jgi:hypothetical protein
MTNPNDQGYTLAELQTLTYTDDQQQAIAEALSEATSCQGVTYTWSHQLVACGRQIWAVFGGVARELFTFRVVEEEGTRFEYLPVVIEGRMLQEWPDEGPPGLLYLVRCTVRRGQPQAGHWLPTYLCVGSLWIDGPNLTNQELADRLIGELEARHHALMRI